MNDYDSVEKRMDLQQALGQLKEQEQQVLILAFQDGQSQRAIAQKLGVSQMSVSRIQKRATEKLKQIMSECFNVMTKWNPNVVEYGIKKDTSIALKCIRVLFWDQKDGYAMKNMSAGVDKVIVNQIKLEARRDKLSCSDHWQWWDWVAPDTG